MSLDIDLCVYVDTGGSEPHRIELYTTNITHNLNKMAKELGVYKPLWHGEGIVDAASLIPVLVGAIRLMEVDPSYYRGFDAPNGWGTYKDFLPWLRALLAACVEHPAAVVEISI